MKKILFILAMCFCLMSCKKMTEKEIAEIDNNTIMSEIINETIDDLKDVLKDPSSLKLGKFDLVCKLKDGNSADKVTYMYELHKELLVYDSSHKYMTPLWHRPNTCYFFYEISFYGKNGFGAYNGDNKMYFIAEVSETSLNKDGTHNYIVFINKASIKCFLELKEDEYSFATDISSLNEMIPTEYKF